GCCLTLLLAISARCPLKYPEGQSRKLSSMGSIPMPLATLTCPACKVNLKPNKPVPPGKKVKCPKCATIFVTGNGAPAPASGIQATAPPQPPPPPQQEEQDQGWEIVDDKPIEAFSVEQAVAKAPQIDFDDQLKAKPKPKSTRRPVPRDEDE